MFDIKVDNAKYWRNCVDAIVNLVDEGVFNITKEGIGLKAMDPSGISMVSFFMPNKAFAKFEISKDANIGLNLENLSKVLSRTRDDEALVMKDTEGKLYMEFIGKSSRRRYKLPMIDIKKGVEKEPNIEFGTKVQVIGEPLKETIKDASLMSSYIQFKTTKDQFVISAHGDSGELEELHEAEGSAIKKIETKEDSQASFNLEYLDNIVKACPQGNTVDISLKSNEPIRLTYNIGDAVLTYFLAPYMES